MSEKKISFWKWLATILFFIAAIMLSSNIEVSKWGFIIFAFGHAIYAVLFTKLKDWAMVVNGAGFFIVDMYGIYNWFL